MNRGRRYRGQCNLWLSGCKGFVARRHGKDSPMKLRAALILAGGLSLFSGAAEAQSVLFDFDSLPPHSGLPGSYTVGGITASFSSTAQGFSIQPANSMGFTPVGFAGNCIYPNSIYPADLLVSFSTPLTDFSLLYAPQELGCDDSATMRVTAYLGGVLVGTATATAANPGTWPSQTLAFSSVQPFDNVVVHYDARPPTCQDWGPIFMADNMQVTPDQPTLVNGVMLFGDVVQFDFAYIHGSTCSAWASTDPSIPLANWTLIDTPTEVSPGLFRFTDTRPGTAAMVFYRATCP